MIMAALSLLDSEPHNTSGQRFMEAESSVLLHWRAEACASLESRDQAFPIGKY